MFPNQPTENITPPVDRASQATDQAIKSTQHIATQMADKLAAAAQGSRAEILPVLNHAVEGMNAFAHRSSDSVRDAAHQLRVKAERASESTASLIRHDPRKSVLIAAATGVALMAMMSLITRNRHSR